MSTYVRKPPIIPPRDADLDVILPFVFGLEKDRIVAIALSKVFPAWHDDASWDRMDIAEVMRELLGSLGIPRDPELHQQPHDFPRLFPLPLRSYQSKLEGEFEGADCCCRLKIHH